MVDLSPNPYLHVDADRVYDPLTDRAATPADAIWPALRAALAGATPDPSLEAGGWAVRDTDALAHRYLLKIVSLETMTRCNQKCYFCPASVAPRPDEEMPRALFERIVNELTTFRATLEAVFLQSYNEPTIDPRFTDLCRVLFDARLPIAVLSNGSGFTPQRAAALREAGILRYLGINLSTLDRDRYAHDRGADHLPLVLRNLEHLAKRPVAQQQRIVVLGEMDGVHRANFDAIRNRFAGSSFEVEMHHAQDRAGRLDVGAGVDAPIRKLAGCDLMGSRPMQHLHITASGKCILCCQDYDERYVVGDLTTRSVVEVLSGVEMASMRRWTYGIDEAPDDFICRRCVAALRRDS